jgi:Protein of unknown function (DUF3592)
MGPIRGQLKLLPFVLAFVVAGLGFMFAPSITMGAIAVVLFVLALFCVVLDKRLALLGQRVQGVVVDHKLEEDCFFPVIEFQDRDGRTRREATNMGRGVKKPPIGSRVMIIYDPIGKGGCEVDRFWRRSGFAIVLCLLGVIFVIGALLSR